MVPEEKLRMPRPVFDIVMLPELVMVPELEMPLLLGPEVDIVMMPVVLSRVPPDWLLMPLPPEF